MSCQIPKEPVAGEPISSLWGALVSRCLRVMQPVASEDILPQQGMGGTRFVLTKKARKSLLDQSFPFQLIDASTDTETKIRVRYGSLAGAPPDGMSPGDDPPYVLNITHSCNIYGIAEWNTFGSVDSRYIDILDTPPDGDAQKGVLIGSVSLGEDGVLSIAQALTWSPDLQLCRRWFEPEVKYTATWF